MVYPTKIAGDLKLNTKVYRAVGEFDVQLDEYSSRILNRDVVRDTFINLEIEIEVLTRTWKSYLYRNRTVFGLGKAVFAAFETPYGVYHGFTTPTNRDMHYCDETMKVVVKLIMRVDNATYQNGSRREKISVAIN